MSAQTTQEQRITARFPRLSGRGLIMGLGVAQLSLIAVAFVSVIAAFTTGRWLVFAAVIVVSLALVPPWFTGRTPVMFASVRACPWPEVAASMSVRTFAGVTPS